MSTQYSRNDYRHALQSLMPTGRAWARSPDSIQTRLFLALSGVYEQNNKRALDLLTDAFPATSTELLPEWEKTLGLPSKCSGPATTLQGRRSQFVARLVNTGGQSANYYINYAKDLGKQISVSNYAPFRCGQSRCGNHLGNQDWFFAWSVQSIKNTVTFFKAGNSFTGEPLASWGDRSLECELSAIAPSHTILIFTYV